MMKKIDIKIKTKKGFSLLPTVLITGIIVAEVGIALTFVMYLANSASFGARLSQEVFFGARSGTSDALIKIIRDKNYSSTGYNLTVGRATVNVVVEQNTPSQNSATITTTATVLNRQKKLRAIVSIDSETGEVTLFSLEEI